MSVKASVVIPTYNCGHYIAETLTSIIGQEYASLEIIVVDDGSTDNTSEVLKEFTDRYSFVKYNKIENSGGPAKPRNVGIDLASGEVIFLFDSDDIALPNKFINAMNVFDNEPSVGMVTTNFSIVDSEAKNVIRERMIDDYYTLQGVLGRPISDKANFIASEDAFAALIKTNFVGTPGVGIRKEVILKVGGFDESLRHIDDREMWLRVAYSTNLAYIDDPSFLYRNHPQSISKKRSSLQIQERISVAKKLQLLATTKVARVYLKEFMSLNYYNLGMTLLKEQGAGVRAIGCFIMSIKATPSIKAFKGLVKAALRLSK